MNISDGFNSLGADMQRSTFMAISIIAVLLVLCCLSSIVLYVITTIFVLYAIYLGYNLFKPKKGLKMGVKRHA